MNRALLYYASMGLVGLSFAARSVPDLVAGDSSIPLWMSAIGGVGMILGSIYEVTTGNSEDFEPERRITLVVVLSAVLTVLGTVMTFLG